MKYHLRIRPEAEEDLKSTFAWYEEQREGLGFDFLLQVDAGLRFLERNAEILPKQYKNTRKLLIKRFPYKVIYILEQDNVIVIGVIHGRRHPKLLRKRSKGW